MNDHFRNAAPSPDVCVLAEKTGEQVRGSPSASFAKPSTLGRSMSRSTVDQSIPPRGGRGSYSIASCTCRDISSLANLLARRSAVSMPADTPAPVR